MQQRKKSNGFTLVELMIAMLLSALIAAAVYNLLKRQARTSQQSVQSSQILRKTQRARLLLDTDIARAGFDPKNYSFVPVISPSTSSQVTLVADFNGDGDTTDPGEQVAYEYDGDEKQLKRNGSPVLTDVKSLTFTYKDAADVSIDAEATPSAIKKIIIHWEIEPESASPTEQGTRTQTEDISVVLRNYKEP